MAHCQVIALSQSSSVEHCAFLTYPGPLDAANGLAKVNSTLSWVAPFSLDLTNIDPDIVYCVDVYNITCGGRDLVSSDCHVTDINYTAFSDGYLYEYIVIPRSNVEGAGNGTQSQWRGVFVYICVCYLEVARLSVSLLMTRLTWLYTCIIMINC